MINSYIITFITNLKQNRLLCPFTESIPEFNLHGFVSLKGIIIPILTIKI